MSDPEGAIDLAAARHLHRELVLALGGYALGFAGGTFVTHERIPVPAFNFVDGARVAVRRQTAFFEKALDHYFQRALRPTFRVDPPVPPHVDRTLRSLGFVPSPDPLSFLAAPTRPADPGDAAVAIVEADPGRLEEVAAFWTHERERDEFRRALEVAVHHPNPGERMTALLARTGDRTDAAALLYSNGEHAEVHAVATRVEQRGRGLATRVVDGALATAFHNGATHLSILSATPRLLPRLAPLGFVEVGRLEEYRLPADAQLAIPPPGPPTPPRWRPPRTGASPT